MKRIVVFVSGAGTNARNIHQYFESNFGFGLSTLVSNKENPELRQWCFERKIPFVLIDSQFLTDDIPIWETAELQLADIIVLAGFLKKLPTSFLEEIQSPIINIHPSLLPKYGGKGMYGMRVHEAVLAAHEKESGITIHYVNENYDEGAIILQKEVDISKATSPEEIQKKVQTLEYLYYPQVIRDILAI